MSFLNMKMRGNIERIKEFNTLGQTDESIVKRFKNRGMNISPQLVNVVIKGELDELDKNNMPKSEVSKLKKELDDLEDGITP